ncbi:flagellin [Sporosarcina sp. BP05]|uniref:flagellin N-terminal helical domain-containing protein n=1 Tax=Sporosarcina sp. BP05 TaxID=2758726 RepID=UPI001645ECF0|nr:flagellin [Sporosarcina sp. BP05]
MRINHNIAALNTHRQLNSATTNQSKSMEKLASGLRINKAGDDAAGLAISEKMRGQIRGLDQASKNSQDGISMIATAEGALNETHDILQRMRELAVQSGNDTNTNDDRKQIQAEVDQLAKEITRISGTTEFNTQNLLAGGLNNTFQIGANKGQNMSVSINAMDAKSLGVSRDTTAASMTSTNTAALSGVSDAGEGLTNAQYSVKVTTSAAALTGLSGSDASVKSNGSGSELTVGGTYTGRDDVASLVVKATGVDSNDFVNKVQYSLDGGVNWNEADISVTGSGASTLTGTGLTIALDGSTTNAVGDTWTFGATASKATAQLADAAGTTNIGSAVTIKNDQTSATIGNSSTDATAKISFNFAALTASTGANTKFDLASVGSNAATFNTDGTVATEASAAGGINVSTQSKANSAIETINKAITTVSTERSKLGAVQNRLEHTINNLNTSSENLTAAESRVRDVDMAKEMMEQTKNSILSQAAQAMLAQSNQMPQGVLQLLR